MHYKLEEFFDLFENAIPGKPFNSYQRIKLFELLEDKHVKKALMEAIFAYCIEHPEVAMEHLAELEKCRDENGVYHIDTIIQ